MSRFIGLLGIIAIIGIAVLFSDNRKKINWRLVGIGLALQVIFALIILKVPAGRAFFNLCSKAITKLLDFTLEGSYILIWKFNGYKDIRVNIRASSTSNNNILLSINGNTLLLRNNAIYS